MDEKHAMLYPALDSGTSNIQRAVTTTATTTNTNIPAEPPPSYDAAMSGSGAAVAATADTTYVTSIGWQPTAPSDHSAATIQTQSFPHGNQPTTTTTTRSVIIEQPMHTQSQLPAILPAHEQQQHSPAATPPPTIVTHTAKLGPNPCAVTCPACGTSKTTRMSYMPNSRTHLCALLLCLVGWCCCACCVPYCMNSCRTGNHYCAKCNTFLGTFNPHERK